MPAPPPAASRARHALRRRDARRHRPLAAAGRRRAAVRGFLLDCADPPRHLRSPASFAPLLGQLRHRPLAGAVLPARVALPVAFELSPGPRRRASGWSASRSSWTTACRSRRRRRSRAICCARADFLPSLYAVGCSRCCCGTTSSASATSPPATIVVHAAARRHAARHADAGAGAAPGGAARAARAGGDRRLGGARRRADRGARRRARGARRAGRSCRARWAAIRVAAAGRRRAVADRAAMTPLQVRSADTAGLAGARSALARARPRRRGRAAPTDAARASPRSTARACEHLALAESRSYPVWLVDRLEALTAARPPADLRARPTSASARCGGLFLLDFPAPCAPIGCRS